MKLSEVSAGNFLVADGGFTCLAAGQKCEVKTDAAGLYIECADGRHYLDGQTDFATGKQLVGLAASHPAESI